MPQGEGTYGSQVGRPSKKRTSYVNDNGWNNKLNKGGNMPDNKTKGNDYASIITKYKSQQAGRTPRQYSNPIDTGQSREKSWPLDTGQSRAKSYASDTGKKAEWTEFMTDMPKGYRTKEEIGAKRKELLAKK
jgi:hypothetical protein